MDSMAFFPASTIQDRDGICGLVCLSMNFPRSTANFSRFLFYLINNINIFPLEHQAVDNKDRFTNQI